MGTALSACLFYASLFPARNDAYSRWTPDGWRPLRSPLTDEVVLAGLTGQGPSISGFMIAPGSGSHSLAIDFDTDDGMRTAIRLGRLMWQEGLPAYVEPSRRGAHLWSTLDEVTPARVIRAGLRGLLQNIGVDAHDPKIELRPGTDTVADDGLGHALRLPLMPHPVTGQRGLLHDPRDRKPIGHTLAETLLAIETGKRESLLTWAERYKPVITHVPSDYAKPHVPYPEDTSKASDILRTMWGVENAIPGRSVRCPAHEDRVASLSILRDDRRVICKAGHCVMNNGDHGRGTYELRQMAPHGR